MWGVVENRESQPASERASEQSIIVTALLLLPPSNDGAVRAQRVGAMGGMRGRRGGRVRWVKGRGDGGGVK